jgi:hypothetical protein
MVINVEGYSRGSMRNDRERTHVDHTETRMQGRELVLHVAMGLDLPHVAIAFILHKADSGF